MHAISITNQTLAYTPHPRPTLGADDVLIHVKAAGMNRADYLQILGRHPVPPGTPNIPGLEVSGDIVELGQNATSRWKIGDRVAALISGGGYAQYARAHKDNCLLIPNHITDIQAASAPEALFTVWNNVFDRGGLTSGQNILIHGGTSGIGTFAIQAAAALGAVVYTTTSSREKLEFCENLSANMAINRKEHDYAEILKDIPLNVILSLGGGPDIAKDQRLMALDARHVSIAYMNAPKAEIDIPLMMTRRHIFTGSTLRGRPQPELSNIAHNVRETLWPLLISGQIDPVIDHVFPLADAATAMEYFTSGQHIGKVILSNP